MRFNVYGGFSICRKENRHGVFGRAFWQSVRGKEEKLPAACGCYVFALQNGQNIMPWYVGKTERRSFEKECFQAAKINIYNEVIVSRNGTPVLFLLPRLTSSGHKFCKPAKGSYQDVDFLESMLIGFALERNPELANVRKTSFLREMIVPGIINTPKARLTKAAVDLRDALDL